MPLQLSGQTPTYLVFSDHGRSTGLYGGDANHSGYRSVAILEAISCGAVFMGANTYIGNAPNFMVKSISDGERYPDAFIFRLSALVCYISCSGIFTGHAGILL